MNIAFLGLGAMGSRMATRLLGAGHEVTVWNRSSQACEALVAAGARAAISPREAAKDAEFVIAMVRDDEASRQIWCDPDSGALGGMKSGSVAIESSTLTPGWVRALDGLAREHRVTLLEAPVSGSRPAAEAGQLAYLLGGDAATVERARPLLMDMGASLRHVGAAGQGALAKLVTNALLGIHVSALAELTALLQAQGADVAAVLGAVAGTAVWAPVDGPLSSAMLARDFRPQFPVELMLKDVGYLLSLLRSDADAPLARATFGVFDRAARQGDGGDNMTAVAKLYAG